MTFFETWGLRAFALLVGIGFVGGALFVGRGLFPAAWDEPMAVAGMTLIGIKVVGVVALALAGLTGTIAQWLRSPTPLDTWFVEAFVPLMLIGFVGWGLFLGRGLFPAAWDEPMASAAMTLLGIKVVGVIVVALAGLTGIVVQWLRRPIQSLKEGEEVREFVEISIFGVLVYVLPGLAERWYGINWWLAAAVTVAVLA